MFRPPRALMIVAMACLAGGCAGAPPAGASADEVKARFGRGPDAVALRRPHIWIDLIGIDNPVRPASDPPRGAKYGWVWRTERRCMVAWFDESWTCVDIQEGKFDEMFTVYP